MWRTPEAGRGERRPLRLNVDSRATSRRDAYVAPLPGCRRTCLDLCKTAVHEQLDAGNVAAVVGGEKYYGVRDLIGCSQPAEGSQLLDLPLAFLASFRGSQQVT